MNKIKVGILGCTGAVGQKFIYLLQNHPWFEISEIGASEVSAGNLYSERVNWKEEGEIPVRLGEMTIKNCSAKFESKILFSALDSSVAGEIEQQKANEGHIIISNSRNHRMNNVVPLVIPEINGEHLSLIKSQTTPGAIITNPNCSTITMCIALYPIIHKFGVEKIIVTTMQAISGAGYPGVPSMDILGNVIPHISGEEDKLETEPKKIFGKLQNDKIEYAAMQISASCNRVPVFNGHTMSISCKTAFPAEREEIIHELENTNSLGLPSSPNSLIYYSHDPLRPQPLRDVNTDKGMAVTVGNLRKCNILDWKFTALGHNTIRGAAGAAILNAEFLVYKKLIDIE